MATARRLTTAEAIRPLQVDEFDDSCNENEDITVGSEIRATLENSDFSNCNSDEPSDQTISENFIEAQSSINQWDTLSSRAGVSWKRINHTVFSKIGTDNRHHILDKMSNQKVHSAHFICLLMSPCFVKLKNILSSMDKLMRKIFL